MQGPHITVGRKSGKAKLDERLTKLKGMATYVGVPAEKASRKRQGINNAELLFVLSKGSPIHRLPPTPWLEPAIAAQGNREPIAHELAECAKAVLHQDANEATKRLKRAGQAGQDAARSWPTDPRNGWPRLAESTEKSRMRRLKGKTLKETLKKLEEFNKLSPAEQARALTTEAYPFIRNVDTGALRNAIIHVEREE